MAAAKKARSAAPKAAARKASAGKARGSVGTSRKADIDAEPSHGRLSARPIWQGHLRLSLVSCPVALYGATSKANDISFHMINPETNNRTRPSTSRTWREQRAAMRLS